MKIFAAALIAIPMVINASPIRSPIANAVIDPVKPRSELELREALRTPLTNAVIDPVKPRAEMEEREALRTPTEN